MDFKKEQRSFDVEICGVLLEITEIDNEPTAESEHDSNEHNEN